MASSGERSTKRVALCSALAAGFAYVGYSIMKNAFCRRPKSKGNQYALEKRINQAIQTDFPLYTAETLALLPELYASHKSVKERVKILNVYAQQHGNFPFAPPNFKTRSLQNTPWSSPRILGTTNSRKFISYSAENVSTISPPGSPQKNNKDKLSPNKDEVTKDNNEEEIEASSDNDSNLSIKEESETIVLRRLDNLFNRARVVTPYEAKSLVSLLNKKDDDIIVRTLSTISNCSAFTINQGYFYDANCHLSLRDLLTHPELTVQIAATQTISNLAVNERAESTFQNCIPILLHHATGKDVELLRTVSLTALSNLALFESNHSLMEGSIQKLIDILENGSSEAQLQIMKLLVNLSTNASIVPSILASKAPVKLYNFLDEKSNFDICLRLLTLLANVMTVASELNLQISDLPMEHKAPCPETLFVLVFGYFGREVLLKKVTLLKNSKDQDIYQQSSKIYDIIIKLS
ncbi:armadillo repeat-containing protein 10-like [Centruroides vittatus]|uniref:armadillo repeat-containing protein 10-like n=1 Tax=Centruroides vittatus TaxID=120091 RepID=UPI00351075D3